MSTDTSGYGQFIKTHREVVLLFVISLVCGTFHFLQPGETNFFMTTQNWGVIAQNISTDALIVVGMTLVIIAGGFDLSVGSTLAFGGIVACKLMVAGTAVPLAVTMGLGAGTLVGFVNGFIITKVGVNPLITTLGIMSIIRGICRLTLQARPVTGLPPSFTVLGEGLPVAGAFNIPYTVLIMVVTVIAADLLLRHSRFLRQVYYVGANEEAARFSGINVDLVRSFTYIVTGFLAAGAGIINSARFVSASSEFGLGTELRIISAVVIGGATLSGGEGTILGAFLGLLLVGVIQNGMEMIGVNIYAKEIVLGTILILAVTIDRMDREKIKRFIHWLRI